MNNKLKIIEYYDSVVNEIDVFTENYLLLNNVQTEQYLMDKANLTREKMIKVIRQIEAQNLNDTSSRANLLNDNQLFDKNFCFVVKFYSKLLTQSESETSKKDKENAQLELALIQTDWFVPKKQIDFIK